MLDPLVIGAFIKKIKALEDQPLLVYSRGALRVGALSMVLPRRVTPLTAAGRSQLLAYLLHDAVFSIGAQVVLPTIYRMLPIPTRLTSVLSSSGSNAVDGVYTAESGVPIVLTPLLATAEFILYACVCLAVQLALSHPNGCLLGWRRWQCAHLRRIEGRILPTLYGRVRLAVRTAIGARRRGAEESAV